MPTTPREERREGDDEGNAHEGDSFERDDHEGSRHDGARESDDLPEHVVDDLLASERRETMLAILAERSAPIVLDDLVRATLAEERETIPSEISQEECTAARTEAYERHLPKLTAVDVVAYDSLVGTLELTDATVAERVDRGG